jgi:polyisoprenoid-binding protein YceI
VPGHSPSLLSAPSDGATTPRASTAFADTSSARDAGAAAPSRDVRAAGPAAGSAGVDTSLAGQWTVGTGTQAGYSIDDTAMGQTQRVVGRTSDVSGTMTIVGSTVTAARAVVNMRTVTCRCIHDTKYRQLMETDKYPTSTFELTKPIALATIPAPGAVTTVPITGNFTLHGVTRSVAFSLKATRIGARIAVNGSIPVKLSDYNIQSPSAGSMGGLSNCDIDLLIAFDRTA